MSDLQFFFSRGSFNDPIHPDLPSRLHFHLRSTLHSPSCFTLCNFSLCTTLGPLRSTEAVRLQIHRSFRHKTLTALTAKRVTVELHGHGSQSMSGLKGIRLEI